MQEKLEQIISSLPKERREKVKVAFDCSPDFIKTPSESMNIALGGGMPLGRIVTFWGTKSAGKSSLCLQIIAEAQKQEKTCLYVDVEGTYDDRWARRLGVDSENLLLDKSCDVGSVTNTCRDFLGAGVDVVVIDSVSAMTPVAQLDNGEMKDFEDNNSMALSARDMGKFLNTLNYVNDNALIVLVAHGSMGPAGAMWKFQMKGGKALEYYSSQVIKLMSNNTSDVKNKEIVAGNKVIQTPGYREVKFKVDWNKVGAQGQEGTYQFHFVGDYVGIDKYRDILRVAVEKGIIKQSGSWYAWKEHSLQGEQKAAAFLQENPEEFELLKKDVHDG